MKNIEFKAINKVNNKVLVVDSIEFRKEGVLVLVLCKDGKTKEGFWVGDDCELIQYTGLKDKNNIKIFEGDIIIDSTSLDKKPWEIIWHEENGGWESGDGTKTPYKSLEKAFEVIGNKFENKELLK